ncbi:FAD-dependent monooxygenase [Chryseobacterium sp.]|uniref:FAD-dependent monooxygenase n=1 Tax=Chryseobacterium sp. TaxID=1871047 RepID=UPI00261AD907|nr:FAD-dependent monooxygenase [Chryseobacterium sp.]
MKNSLLNNKRIAIIGGGPVGLTIARLLQIKGADVKVYERDINSLARVSGGTLDVHKNTGQKTFLAAGLLQKLFENSKPTGMCSIDLNGKLLITISPDKSKPEIDRPILRKILLESLLDNTVIWNANLKSISKIESAYELKFENGLSETADIVIATDGSRSKARKFVTDELPEETGTYVIQGEIKNLEKDCPKLYEIIRKNNLACVQDKKTIFLQNRSDGSACFYISFRKTEQWLLDIKLNYTNVDSVNQFLFKIFKDWNPLYHELFNASNEYKGFPLRVFNTNYKKKNQTEKVTLAGDAAHAMTPFGGMGVNMGLKDALLLTNNLTDNQFHSIEAAISDYEKKMNAYTKPIQTETSIADDRIHKDFEHAFYQMKNNIKNSILKVVQYVGLFFLLLTVGVFWGNYFSLSRSFDQFSLTEIITIAKNIVHNLAVPMRILSIATIILISITIYMYPVKKQKWFYFKIFSLMFFIFALLLTILFEVPINNQIMVWTKDNTPHNWQAIISRWQSINVLRTFFAVLSFLLFTASVIKPFQKNRNI